MTIENIKKIALEKHGMEMTNDMAAKYIQKYADKRGLLSEEELDNVSGGYTICDREYHYGKYCEPCGVWCDDVENSGGYCSHPTMRCPVCGTIYK